MLQNNLSLKNIITIIIYLMKNNYMLGIKDMFQKCFR